MFDNMLSTFKLNTLLENPSLVIAEITSDIPSSSDATAENNWILLEKSSGKITRLTQQLKTSESQYNFYEGQLSLNATTGNFLFRHGLKWEVLDLNIEKSLSADLIVIIQHFVDLFTDHEHLSLAACPALDFGYEIIKNDNQANLKSFNLSIKFVFNPAGHFSFDPNASEVKNNKEVAIRDAELVMTSYEAILAQILASDIEISVSNTLNPGQLIPLNANLANENNGFSDFLTLVINWIKNFIAQPDEQNLFAADHESPLAASPIHYVWNSAQELSNPQKLFPLEVHLVTQRKLSNLQSQHQVVDPAKPAINTGVEENLTIVKPYSLINLYGMEEPDQQISVLKQFTQGVENILNPMDVKLAISVPGEGSSLIDGNFSELWVMRMKDLLDHCHTPSDSIKDLEHQYYSIAPFSTTLLNSSAAEIYTFEHYLGQTDISTTYQLTDIDLETLTERFLHDVQLMRSKPVLEALALIDGQSNKIPSKHIGYLQQQVTENLADRIVSQLRPLMIIPDPKTTKIAGTEKFKKALLTDLHCAYTSAFLLPVNINPLCYDQSAESYLPLAFTSFPSQLSAADDNSDNGLQDAITIPGVTSAHHPHQNDAYLAYGNADLRRHSSIRMKADLDIKQIMITNAAPDPDQSTIPESIGWLSIILPGDALSSLSLEETVPNPVKKYPDQVSLISQTFFDEPLQENIKTPDIAALLSTGFAFKYRLNEFQLQDCYQFEITFNSMNDQSAALKVHSSIEPSLENFLHKIFQFNMVSPQFMAYFEQELPKIQQDITTTELPTLQKLLKAFWKLAGEVVSLWPSVTDVTTPAPPLSPSVSQRMISFQVREWASIQPNGEALFESVISDWKSGISDYNFFLLPELEGWTAEPQLSIDGKGITPIPMGMEGSKQIAIRYFSTSGNEKKYLSFEEGAEIVSRRIALYQLHLPGIQNINTSISILRNTGLNNHLTTDKHFVYQAQPISFAHEAVPNKIIQENINWPDLVPPQNLEAHINNIFKLLSTQQNPGNLPLFIQIEIQLKTKLLANDFSPEISIPILLIPEEKFVDGAINEALSTKISEGILTWFSATNPSVDLSTLSFSIQIFSDTLQNLTPLIVLENIRLNIANIPDIMAAVKN